MNIDLCALRAEKTRLENSVLAPNTRLAYDRGWRDFERWCASASLAALPCAADTLALYVVAVVERGLSFNTISLHVAGVRYAHRRAGLACVQDASFRELMSGISRTRTRSPGAKAALTLAHLQAICAQLGEHPREVRNRALFVAGFASAMRRGELSALTLADLRFVPEGVQISLRKSKTDQRGNGREIGIQPGRAAATCPVRTLQAWLRVRGDAPGLLFCHMAGSRRACRARVDRRLSGEGISRLLQRSMEAIGLDRRFYGGHSMRAGCITAAVKGGASVFAIMQRTGHRSVETVNRYVRPASCFECNPLENVL